MTGKLELALLGKLEIRRDGAPIAGLSSTKAQALLSYLAVTGRPHFRTSLTGLLWGDLPEPNARANLRRELSSLRQVVSEHLTITRQEVAFNREAPYWLDVELFESGATHLQQSALHLDQVERLREAVELYRGDLLDGFYLREAPAFEEWVLIEQTRLRELALQALHRLATHYAAQGEAGLAKGIHYTRRLLALEPSREEAHCALMRLLALSGQRGAALAQYEECRDALVEDLGVEPGPETQELLAQIRAGELRGPGRRQRDAESIEVERPPAPRKHNLPAQPTRFVGRQAELAELARLLAEPGARLVTVLGVGGSGKTRLALEVAAAQLDRYADGVFFVALAPLQAAAEVVPAVARALGFAFYQEEGGIGQERREPRQQLLDYLRRKRLLLVLDNFEHLLSGTQLVAEILQTAPQVQVLATSRTRLNLQGEHLFHLAGMPYLEQVSGEPERWREQVVAQLTDDGPQYSALQLFVVAARRAQAGFELTADNVDDVVRVCRLVDGMPLGILLAAAWVELLTPGEIADEIEQSLDFLETELRDVPERQRSLRAAFEHSWRLLTERERELLAGLSVFRGDCSRVAAERVTRATLRELLALADKSLVDRDEGGRYRLHELIRQYAAQRRRERPELDETAHERHCAYYIGVLEEWGEAIKGPRHAAALAELDLEIENARAAWESAVVRGQIERLDQALEELCTFYTERGRPAEGEAACRLAAEKLATIARGGELRTMAHVLAWQAFFRHWLEPVANAELVDQLLAQSLELLERPDLAELDTRRERAFVWLQRGRAAHVTDFKAAQRHYEQSLALYREMDEPWWTAETLFWLCDATAMLGLFDEAKYLQANSLELYRAMGDRKRIARSLASSSLGDAHRGLSEAASLGQESIRILRELGDRAGLAHTLYCVGTGMIALGRLVDGYELLAESVAIYDDVGASGSAAWSGVWLALADLHLGQYGSAQNRIDNAVKVFREKKLRFQTGCCLSTLGTATLARNACVEAVEIFEESIALFRHSKTPEPLSRALSNLGLAVLEMGDSARAQQHLVEALQMARLVRLQTPILCALAPTALLLAELGQPERAVEVYALTSRYPFIANSRWFEDVVGQKVAAASAALPRDVVAAAQARGEARDLEGTVAELLAEFAAADSKKMVV